MNNFELENAAKSIFLHYLNEPDVLDVIRKKLSNPSEVYAGEENQIQRCVCLNGKSNSTNSQLNEILNRILDNQKTIKDLINSKIHTETQSEIALLTELEKFKKENENLKNDNNRLMIEMKNKEEDSRLEIAKYAVFEESLEVWNCLNSLNYENREYIERLCGGSDVLATLSLGRDDGKIEQLWYYLRDLAIKGDAEKIEVLKLNRYFEFCLKVANSTKTENEKYIILNIEPESEFDIDTCIRTSDSRQIGKIRDILVKSVMVGKSVKYKAIVRVE